MKLLIAHGDATSRLALRRVAAELAFSDLEVIESGDGMATVDMLLGADSPAVAVIDWDLPECDGLELCRLARAYREAGPPYIILLARSDYRLAEGLEAGADDCVHTPADADELRARINVGRRFATLPWEKVMRASASSADRSGEETFSLAAQRSMNGDDLDDDAVDVCSDGEHDGDCDDAVSGAKFELASVLVVQ
jgi:DNA-binding response OmpR family regulator